MKSIVITMALALATVVGISGQTATRPAGNPDMKCAGPRGVACSSQHVRQLSDAARMASSGPRASLAQVKSISLASPDGTLKCQQVNGQRCTAEQAKALYEIGRAINLTVSFSGSESK